MDVWGTAITSFGGSISAVGIAGYALKRALEDRLAKNMEEFKSALKREADIHVEHLRASLQIDSKAREISLSSLHEKRVNAIAGLYPLILDLRYATRWLLEFWASRHPADIRRRATELNEQMRGVYHEYYKARIFLSPSLCAIVERVLRAIEYPLAQYITTLAVYDDHELADHTTSARDDACRELEQVYPGALVDLEQALRQLLGVSEAPAAEHRAKVSA